jgi:triosephosphate isomerase
LGNDIPLLYGGSVTDKNATTILTLPHVNGILVGGASLKKESFERITRS